MGKAFKYPPDSELLQGCVEYGSPARYAEDGLGISESSLRRYLKRHAELREQIDEALGVQASNTVRQTSPPPQPGDEVSREETLEAEVKDLRKALLGARAEDVREERVIGLLTGSLEAATPRYEPRRTVKPSKRAEHEFVLMLSDLHAAEVVSAEEMNGANAYDWKILLGRMDDLRRGLLSYQEHRRYPVDTLHVACLGDLLSGNIHEELAETNEMPMAEATVQLGLDLGEWLASLVPHFKRIRVAGVVGNHPRPGKKMRSKHRYDNGDWTCMQVMKQYVSRYNSITVDVPKAQKYPLEVLGQRLLLMHGDGVRSTMVDMPAGGVVRLVGKLQNQYARMGLPIDHVLMGHFHELNLLRGAKVFINGSVKGPDEFSMDRFGGGEPAMQTLLTFHAERGWCDLSRIDLGSLEPALDLAA